MNNDPASQLPEESELQRVFDESAAHASEAQLERMVARAERIPNARRMGRGRTSTLLISLAAAAAVALVAGGAWWAAGRDTPAPVASTTAVQVPTSPPPETTAVASAEPDQPLDDLRDTDDETWLPNDPLAVLDGDWDNGGVWMSELDLLYGPIGDDDDAYWEEMDALMEEGG